MTYLRLFDCSGCNRISYYDCIDNKSDNLLKKDGYVYYDIPPSKCVSCSNDCNVDLIKIQIQKKIQNTVRVPVGLYLDNLASLTVKCDSNKNKSIDSVQKPISNPRLIPGKLALSLIHI